MVQSLAGMVRSLPTFILLIWVVYFSVNVMEPPLLGSTLPPHFSHVKKNLFRQPQEQEGCQGVLGKEFGGFCAFPIKALQFFDAFPLRQEHLGIGERDLPVFHGPDNGRFASSWIVAQGGSPFDRLPCRPSLCDQAEILFGKTDPSSDFIVSGSPRRGHTVGISHFIRPEDAVLFRLGNHRPGRFGGRASIIEALQNRGQSEASG